MRDVHALGLACDWMQASWTHLMTNRSPPRTVFVHMDMGIEKVVKIVRQGVLPNIKQPIVLFTISHDKTMPMQVDKRYRTDSPPQLLNQIRAVLDSPLIERWVVENLDTSGFHDKLMPVPLGFFCHPYYSCGNAWWPVIKAEWIRPLAERPLMMCCNGRLHEELDKKNASGVKETHPQFQPRKHMLKICSKRDGPWSEFTDYKKWVPDKNGTFSAHWWQNHSFVLCAHGGGIDPSPRAVQAIAAGAIPIIQHSALDAAYSHLPVAFVDDFTPEAITLDKLRRWKEELTPYYDDPSLRIEVVKRLTMDYWWRAALDGTSAATGDRSQLHDWS